MAPIKEFYRAGINVACAQDCNDDPWYPLGNADMFEVAKMGAHVGHMMGISELETMFASVTTFPAAVMHLDEWGIEAGKRANFVLFDASSVREALRVSAERLLVVRDGRIVLDRRAGRSSDGAAG